MRPILEKWPLATGKTSKNKRDNIFMSLEDKRDNLFPRNLFMSLEDKRDNLFLRILFMGLEDKRDNLSPPPILFMSYDVTLR